VRLLTTIRALTGFGDAAGGTDHWWGQRITGVMLVLLGVWFVASLVLLPSLQYDAVVVFVGDTANGILLSLLCLVAAFHSYLGVQVVIEDYVHAAGLHTLAIALARLAHAVLAAASLYAIFAMGPGA